ncbi:MAG: nucleotidyltransferase family protein [Planctomycetota bacterium]
MSPFPAQTPEARLLLASARAACDSRRAERDAAFLEQLAACDVAWPRLFEWAVEHRVTPTLYRALDRSRGATADLPPRVPAIAWQMLSRHIAHIGRYNLVVAQELRAILDEFERHRIEVIPYKGPVWADALYGGVAQRQYGDLDLLLRRDDVASARRLIEDRGYRAMPTSTQSGLELKELMARDCELGFERLGPPRLRLELHWELFDAANCVGLEADRVFAAARPTRFAERDVLAFAPADWLLYLCAHGGEKHSWSRLKWIVDLARFLEQDTEIDVFAVMERARSSGRSESLALGFVLATTLLGAESSLRLPTSRDAARNVARAGFALGHLFRADHDFPGFSEWRSYLTDARLPLAAAAPPELAMDTWRCRRLYFSALCQPTWSDRRARGTTRGKRYEQISRIAWLAQTYKAGIIERLR